MVDPSEERVFSTHTKSHPKIKWLILNRVFSRSHNLRSIVSLITDFMENLIPVARSQAQTDLRNRVTMQMCHDIDVEFGRQGME